MVTRNFWISNSITIKSCENWISIKFRGSTHFLTYIKPFMARVDPLHFIVGVFTIHVLPPVQHISFIETDGVNVWAAGARATCVTLDTQRRLGCSHLSKQNKLGLRWSEIIRNWKIIKPLLKTATAVWHTMLRWDEAFKVIIYIYVLYWNNAPYINVENCLNSVVLKRFWISGKYNLYLKGFVDATFEQHCFYMFF